MEMVVGVIDNLMENNVLPFIMFLYEEKDKV